MAQIPLTIATITITAGTAQRLLSDPDSKYRYMKSVIIAPLPDNGGLVFVGDENVSDTNFAAYASGENGTAVVIDGDHIFDSLGSENNFVDLYNTWVDGDMNGDSANISVLGG